MSGVKKRGGKVASSKAMEEFLAQSTVPAGSIEKAEQEKEKQKKLEELTEKYFGLTHGASGSLNYMQLTYCRVV